MKAKTAGGADANIAMLSDGVNKEKLLLPDKSDVSSQGKRHQIGVNLEATSMKTITCTLLELIRSVNAFTEDDREVAVVVAHLVNSGRVRLCGNFAGAKIKLSPESSAPAQAS